MALKALDQRLASSHNATNSTSPSNFSVSGSSGTSLSPNQNTDLSSSAAVVAAQPPRGEPKPANGSDSTENPKHQDEAGE